MIKKFKIFESIEDDYYTVLIKLEEISKRIKRFNGRLYIDEEKENEYIIFTVIKLTSYASGKYVFDPIKKEYEYDKDTFEKNTIFKETIKVDIPNLTMIWLDVKDTEEYLKYGAMYYAPDKREFKNVDEIIKFLRIRYYYTDNEREDVHNYPLHWTGEPFQHPVGRRKFEWDEDRSKITPEDPLGEEQWDYEWPFDIEY